MDARNKAERKDRQEGGREAVSNFKSRNWVFFEFYNLFGREAIIFSYLCGALRAMWQRCPACESPCSRKQVA